jgi:3-hydroxyacyl-CoA dehydrogenase/3-hydroxy-2-methylbutyryl-CoA dehydrogenase
LKIQGKTFVVTGGASGLGDATTRMIVANGGNVCIADRNQELMDKLQAELGKQVTTFVTDVVDEDSVDQMLAHTVASFPGTMLGGCINCAGVGMAKTTVNKAGAHDIDTFDFVCKVNLYGTFSVCAKTAAIMSKQAKDEDGEVGCIVNVASVAAFEGQKGQVAYAASKGGVVAMALPMARDLGRFGIRVNTICPGTMLTPMMVMASEKVKASLLADVIAPKRMGDPNEFALSAKFLIENAYMNAQVVRCDGGVRMSNL